MVIKGPNNPFRALLLSGYLKILTSISTVKQYGSDFILRI
jgi:hypothetical protein